MISIKLRQIFATILLCSMLAYISFGLSASWRRISNLFQVGTERSETKQYPSNRLDLSENISCYNKDMKFSQVVSD